MKKACTPQKKQSDKAWQAMILSSEANQLLIKNAITAVKRDNLEAYWDAVSQVDCMEVAFLISNWLASDDKIMACQALSLCFFWGVQAFFTSLSTCCLI